MKKKYIVKNNYEFNNIIQTGKCLKNKYYIIYYKENHYNYDRYGISVGKKLGNAVFRNHYKRKIRSIIDNYRKNIHNHNDYVIIIRKEITNLTFKEMENAFITLINS